MQLPYMYGPTSCNLTLNVAKSPDGSWRGGGYGTSEMTTRCQTLFQYDKHMIDVSKHPKLAVFQQLH